MYASGEDRRRRRRVSGFRVGGRGFCSMIYETAVRPSFVISRRRPIYIYTHRHPYITRPSAYVTPFRLLGRPTTPSAARPASVVL